MAFVNGYEFDVFVSYAHADNEADAFGDAWVQQFVTNLSTALAQRSGKVDQIKFYFDARRLQGNHPLDELLNNVKRSALFLAVGSPSYVSRDWTLDELRTFAANSVEPERLFTIERLPLDEHITYPEPINSYYRLPFWLRDQADSDIALTITPRVNGQLYYSRVHRLAEQIRGQLVKMSERGGQARGAAAPPPVDREAARLPAATVALHASPVASQPEHIEGVRPVLVAQVTEDLEYEREQLVSYLSQFGIPVLPAEAYPQNGPEFRKAVEEDLRHAGLFVQLLGPTAPRKSRDFPAGYLIEQNDLALAASVRVLKWRSPTLDLERVVDPAHREQLLGETVVMTGFEAFKADVLRLATPPPPPPEPMDEAMIFINADATDQKVADSVFEKLRQRKLPVIVSQASGSSREVRADLERNWKECGAVILVYGEANPFWVRNQIMLYTRLKRDRRAPPRPFKLLYCPPEEKASVGVALPEVEDVDCRHGLTPEAVDRIVLDLGS